MYVACLVALLELALSYSEVVVVDFFRGRCLNCLRVCCLEWHLGLSLLFHVVSQVGFQCLASRVVTPVCDRSLRLVHLC